MGYPKISPSADPRVRIVQHAARNFRTEVQDQAGEGTWHVTGYAHGTRAEALLTVDDVCTRHFGPPTHDRIRALMAQVERLTAERADLAEKLSREKDRATALYVDGDRREQRALDLLPDCEAHRRELHYLRHMASWNWHAMNDAEQARQAIVTALILTARGIDPDSTVKGADVAGWLLKAVDAQDKPLRRKSYPTLADCLRSDSHGCAHDGLSADLVADIAKGLGLGDAYESAIQRAADDHLNGAPHPVHLCPYE